MFTATFDECTRLKKFISEGRDEATEEKKQEIMASLQSKIFT